MDMTVAPEVVAAPAAVAAKGTASTLTTTAMTMNSLRKAPTMLLHSGCGCPNTAATIVMVIGGPAKGAGMCIQGGTATPWNEASCVGGSSDGRGLVRIDLANPA